MNSLGKRRGKDMMTVFPPMKYCRKNIMKEYYESIRQNYDISSEQGLMNYIHDKIQ